MKKIIGKGSKKVFKKIIFLKTGDNITLSPEQKKEKEKELSKKTGCVVIIIGRNDDVFIVK